MISFLKSPITVYFLFLISIGIVLDLAWRILQFISWICKRDWFEKFTQFFVTRNVNSVKVVVAVAFFSLLLSFYAAYEGAKIPPIKEVIIYSQKITEKQKVVLLSDLHISREIPDEKINKIIQRVNALKPDLIILSGDILDDEISTLTSKAKLLADLKAKSGVYFVLGNHEIYFGREYQSKKLLRAQNLILLENSGIEANAQIYVGGIPDSFSRRVHGHSIDLQRTFANSREGQFRILVSHTPRNFYAKTNFDLELAGHTHGGQIFPFFFMVYFLNDFFAGLYDMANGAKIYVSRGTGQWGPQMRLFAPSEITLIKLLPMSLSRNKGDQENS